MGPRDLVQERRIGDRRDRDGCPLRQVSWQWPAEVVVPEREL
jgi:hypothetical protein